MAKVIYERLSNQEAQAIYGKGSYAFGSNTDKDLQRLGSELRQRSSEKPQSNQGLTSSSKREKNT